MSTDRETLTWAIKGLETEAAHYRERANQCEAKARDLRTRMRDLSTGLTDQHINLNEMKQFEAMSATTPAPETEPARRRMVSEETRRKQSEKMRARWAERHAKTTKGNKKS